MTGTLYSDRIGLLSTASRMVFMAVAQYRPMHTNHNKTYCVVIIIILLLLINYVSALAHFLTVIIVCWGG